MLVSEPPTLYKNYRWLVTSSSPMQQVPLAAYTSRMAHTRIPAPKATQRPHKVQPTAYNTIQASDLVAALILPSSMVTAMLVSERLNQTMPCRSMRPMVLRSSPPPIPPSMVGLTIRYGLVTIPQAATPPYLVTTILINMPT